MRWFYWLLNKVRRRRWFVSVDPAKAEGEYNAYCRGYVDKDGNVHIIECYAIRYRVHE